MAAPADGSPLSNVDFLDLISHELRQPLTAARGSLTTLLERDEDPAMNVATRRLLLEIASRNLNQLSFLIDSLRVFTDADQGRLHVTVESVSVRHLFDDCAEDFPEPRTKRKLQTFCSPGLQVSVDQTLFKQVLTNIVANAIKFSPAGSTVTLEAALNEDRVLFIVQDEGPGFAALDKERIFEKSVRLDQGASGLGLGLYVARAIVEAHSGQVRATSEEGHGATFEIAIPA